ncbi:DUF899 family protein [Isoptericola sediminis]|uniref:DUF899 domain-containing protein n=1 Tax=Isoptericola sediminis TaxID=2733572 RepID=A0A849JXZ3_9MICO|nr:DUF899 family protein [Isoptericola sediminis]NNU28182.1 DUF899 domain-containing protein [Isoptericola sediminis]
MSVQPSASTRPGRPAVVDRANWLRARRTLLSREKAHTREGDALAAARRRQPMTAVDPATVLVGAGGRVTLLDLFEGRDQLVTYQHMWHAGHPVEGQCVGCTASVWSLQDAVYLHHRGVSFAVVCDGPWDEVAPYVAFMGYRVPWYSLQEADDEAVHGGLSDDRGLLSCYLRVGEDVYLTHETTHRGVEAVMAQLQVLDLTVYGRQEAWEDSPDGWPQHPTGTWWTDRGRPVPQWTRPGAAPFDPDAPRGHHH